MDEKMNMRWKWISIVCLMIGFSMSDLHGQEVLGELMEQLVNEEEDGSSRWENSFEELSEWQENPLDINTATKEQWERFPFLSEQMIENILYYLYKYGPMLTPNELRMVEGMDGETVRYLLPFVRFQMPENEEPGLSLKQVLKDGRQALCARLDVPFYAKAGYKDYPAEVLKKNPNKQYMGYGYYHNLRYSFHYKDKVYAGIVAENDAGEPFFAGKNKKGYDFYSPYFFLRGIGKLKALAMGNYRLSYGMGLVMNTDFSMGKTVALSTLGNKSQGIRKHSSTDEYNYFQGMAISYKLWNRWAADAFYSYRKMDGIVDSVCIRSLKKDGYHRLVRDFEKKNTFANQVMGGHLSYNGKYGKLGWTVVYPVFSKPLNPDNRYYNTYYPRGKDFFNIGWNYKFFIKRFSLSGETAMDKHHAFATVNMLRYSSKGGSQWVIMNRFYDARYQAVYARSIGEGSTVQNESGFYVGCETKVVKHVKMTCYGDFFYFPWKKYLVSKAGTKGFDGLLQFSYSPGSKWNMFVKYRYKEKEKDFAGKEKQTLPYIQQKCRYRLDYRPAEAWTFGTTLDYARVHYRGKSASNGFLASQGMACKLPALPFRFDISSTWFSTDDYASRLTLYEKNVLYAFSMPSFYYKGTRLAVNACYEWNKHFILQVKYGMTHYFNREKISSGLEEIDGSTKNDLCLQLRMKF